MLNGTYYRWTQSSDGKLSADILGLDITIVADPEAGTVVADLPFRPLSLDEARMIGVRLIEAASLADAGRSTRGLAPPDSQRVQ
jgi:hypothetical protein